MTALLGLFFFITALFYASVGFGGGSTYNALLVLHGADYRILPSIALICNIIVVTGGVWRFSRQGHVSIRRLLPWIAVSVPAAWIGGRIPTSETVFIGVLGLSLLAAGSRLLVENSKDGARPGGEGAPPWIVFSVGGVIGFISGLVGIGGGIFLAPVLYFLRWGSPRQIAGASSLFILVNSLSGLSGQLIKLNDFGELGAIVAYWPLLPAVLIGGQIGSRLGSAGLSALTVKRLTAALIIFVAVRLLYRLGAMYF